MAYSLLGYVSASNSGTGPLTSGAADTSGATLFTAYTAWYAPAGATVFTDGNGNTWTPRTIQTTVGGALTNIQAFDCVPTIVGAGHTFSSSVCSFGSMIVLWYSGAKQTTPFNAENGVAFVASSQATGAVNPSEDNELITTATTPGFGSFAVTGISGGFNIPASIVGGGAFADMWVGDLVQTSAASANPTWSFAGPVNGAAVIQCYKAAASSGSPISEDYYVSPSGLLLRDERIVTVFS